MKINSIIKYLLIIIIGVIFSICLSNRVESHCDWPPPIPPEPPGPGTIDPGSGPATVPDNPPSTPPGTPTVPQPPKGPGTPPPPTTSPGQWQKPPLSSEGVTYDLVGGFLPEMIKQKLAPTSATVAVNPLDPNLIGIELLNSFFTAFDPYQITSVSSFNLPILNRIEIFNPPLNTFLSQHVVLTILQSMVHLESCPEAPAAEYLVELGQPSLVGAKVALNVPPDMLSSSWVRSQEAGKRISEYVLSSVGVVAPQPPPEPPSGTNHFETMINRLIVEELGKSYYFPGARDFAPCLKGLGEDIIPYIIKTAKTSEHSLIKRNAVSLLGVYNTPEVVKALREILLDNYDKDKVIRNRALSALINKRDREIVPFLIGVLKNSDDSYFKTLAAYTLGILGDKQAVKPLIEYINTDPNNREVLWAAIPALAMLGDNSEEVKNLLRKIAERTRLSTKTFALLALYALGDDSVVDKLGIHNARNPFGKIDFITSYFCIKVLGRRGGEKDLPTLLWMINDEAPDPRMRFIAMCQIKFTKEHIEMLKNLIAQRAPAPILKAYALYLLFGFQDKDIIANAETVLKDSFTAINKKGIKLYGEGFDTVIALRILGILGANKESLLKDLISQLYQSIKTPVSKKDQEIERLLPRPPMMETAINELGKIRTPEARAILVGLLGDKDFPYHAEVAQALGNMSPEKSMIKALIKTLSDKDGWTRYCAYYSLKRLTAQDFACEWVFGPEQTRTETVAKWEKWWKEEGSKKD